MANFFIQTDKPYYFAGETVNGNILVNVVTYIQSTGISLKFTGYQCVKWKEWQELIKPQHVQGQPPPYDPIAAIPPHMIFHSDDFSISSCESEDQNGGGFRPPYIRTSAGRVYKMTYHESRNVFSRIKTMVYICNGLAPGQYSFPICFKTFEGWPASFDYNTSAKKGKIIYHLTAAVEPANPSWNLSHSIEITLRETKPLKASSIQSNMAISSCCCISKGSSAINVHFQKDGYIPGQMVNYIIEIDNTNCQANVDKVNVSLRAGNGATSDNRTICSRELPGIMAGMTKGNDAIRDGFMLPANQNLKPTCNGKLLSSVYDLIICLEHDVACQCCSDEPTASLRIMVFPIPLVYMLPQTFTVNWAPKMMPIYNVQVTNNFGNPNMQQMQQQPQMMQQQQPQQMQQQQPQQQQQSQQMQMQQIQVQGQMQQQPQMQMQAPQPQSQFPQQGMYPPQQQQY